MEVKHIPPAAKGISASGEASTEGNRERHALVPEAVKLNATAKSTGQGVLNRAIGIRSKLSGTDSTHVVGPDRGYVPESVTSGIAALKALDDAGMLASPDMASIIEAAKESDDYSEKVSEANEDGASRILSLSPTSCSTIVRLYVSEEEQFWKEADKAITDRILVFRQPMPDDISVIQVARAARAYAKAFVASHTQAPSWGEPYMYASWSKWNNWAQQLSKATDFANSLPVFSPEAVHDRDALKDGLSKLAALCTAHEKVPKTLVDTIDEAFAFLAEYDTLLTRPDATSAVAKRKGKPKAKASALADVI